jgi:photosystem II stability/assembly factor-like uncharacterized protein
VQSKNAKSDYLLHTADAGRHWSRVPVGGFGAFGLGAPQVVFVDAEHAWSAARLAPDHWAFEVCYQTSADGGRTWKLISQPRARDVGLTSLSAVDATHAWLGGSPGWPHRKATLFATADGGRTWQPTTFSGQAVAAVFFADLQDGWVVVIDGKSSLIYGTRDGGKTWRKQYSFSEGGPLWSFRAAGGMLFASDGFAMLAKPLATVVQ